MRCLFLLLATTFALAASADPGDLDLSFGKHKGYLTSPNSVTSSVVQQQDGKLVIAGTTIRGDEIEYVVRRYNSDGSADANFNDNADKNFTLLGCSTALAADAYANIKLIKQSDEKLVLLAYCVLNPHAVDQWRYSVVRYNSDGTLDTAFNNTGIITTDLSDGFQAVSLMQQVDGKLVVGGCSGGYPSLARYNADGTPDSGFGNAGVIAHTTSGNPLVYANKLLYGCMFSLIQLPDGKIIAGGYSNLSGNPVPLLMRYNTDGSLDANFNGGGIKVLDPIITTPEGYLISGQIYAMVLQPDNKIVASAFAAFHNTYYSSDGLSPSLLRFNADGSLDTTFNGTGIAVADSLNATGYGGDNLILQPDGKLLSVASVFIPLALNLPIPMALFRYNGNGTIDTSFGDKGVLVASHAANDFYPKALIQQADQKLVVAGFTPYGFSFIVRLLNNDSEHDGDDDHDEQGTSVTTADFDSDGVDDVVSSSPHADGVDMLKHAGTIKVISGKDHSVLKKFSGNAANQYFGSAVAALADQDSDGVPDLLVGEPQGKGRVALYSGADGSLIKTVVSGKVDGQKFGTAISIGDVNNDTVADLVVGAPGGGKVFVYNGVTAFNTINPSPLYVRSGNGKKFGAAVAVDNQHRLLVGSPASSAGKVEVFAGNDGSSSTLFTLNGTQKGEKFGSAISVIASNGHWLVGAPAANSSSVINGKAVIKKSAGKVSVFSDADASLLSENFGNADGDHFGGAVSAASDIDEDGTSDVVVGAPSSDVSAPVAGVYQLRKKSGRVNVVSGAIISGP